MFSKPQIQAAGYWRKRPAQNVGVVLRAALASSPVLPGLEQLVWVPLGLGLCNTVLFLYLERVTPPHFPLSSFYILVSEADGGLEFKKRRCSTKEKSQFWDREQEHTDWERLRGEVMLWQESSRDQLQGQCESHQSSAGNSLGQRKNLQNRKIPAASGPLQGRGHTQVRTVGRCLERGRFLSLLARGKTNQPKSQKDDF